MYNYDTYDSAKMDMVDYFRKQSYNAQTLSSFSDYKDDSKYNNFIEVVKQNRETSKNKIEQIDFTPQTTISLKKGEEIFKEEIIKNYSPKFLYIILLFYCGIYMHQFVIYYLLLNIIFYLPQSLLTDNQNQF